MKIVSGGWLLPFCYVSYGQTKKSKLKNDHHLDPVHLVRAKKGKPDWDYLGTLIIAYIHNPGLKPGTTKMSSLWDDDRTN